VGAYLQRRPPCRTLAVATLGEGYILVAALLGLRPPATGLRDSKTACRTSRVPPVIADPAKATLFATRELLSLPCRNDRRGTKALLGLGDTEPFRRPRARSFWGWQCQGQRLYFRKRSPNHSPIHSRASFSGRPARNEQNEINASERPDVAPALVDGDGLVNHSTAR